MDIPVDHESFRTRRLAVRTATLWKSARVLVDGAAASGKGLKYEVDDDNGRRRTVVLKPLFVDPVPRLQIDSEPLIEVARPLRWYEWAWMASPMLLVVAGGGVGALFGILAVWTSTRVFRSERGTFSKYLLSAIASSVATLLFIIGATVVQLAVAKE